MKLRKVTILFSLVLFLLSAPFAVINAQVPGVNVNVSNLGRAQSEVGIAIDPTNPQNLVAVSNNIADLSRLGVWFSTDGGANWTANFIDENEDGFGSGDSRFDPNVAFDSDGNVYVVYSTKGTGNRLLLARSTDGGQNFNQVTTVTTDAGPNNLHTAMVTTRSDGGGADDVLVVWSRPQPGGESIEAALSLDAGATFPTTNNFINDALQRTFLPWAAVDASGDFQVVWEVNTGGGAGVILHDTLDGTTLADGATNTQVTTVQITDFDAATSKIPAQPDRGLFSVSTIDVDRSTGRIFVSYTDRPNTGSDDTDIYVRFSDDDGATWSPRTQINDDSTTTSQFMPRLAIDQITGFIGVIWYDARDDTTNNQEVDVFVSVSEDGGTTWSANQRVSTAVSDESNANAAANGNNYGEYFGLIALDGIAYAAWTDARAANFTAGTNEDVYTAVIFVDVPPVCDADGPYVAECGGVAITLDGSGSFDPDGGSLTFEWVGPFDGSPASGVTPNVEFPAPTGNKQVDLEVEDDEGVIETCTAQVTVQDTLPPNLTAPDDVTEECESPVGTDVDLGTPIVSDLCDASVDVINDAPPLFPLGSTTVNWTATDDASNQTAAQQVVTIEDTIPPVVDCNNPPTIIPPDAPISFTATATDLCEGDIIPEITGFDCFTLTKKGKRIDKTESCEVAIAGDTITILDSGGVGDNITWTVRATDSSGNVTVSPCAVEVVNPDMGP